MMKILRRIVRAGAAPLHRVLTAIADHKSCPAQEVATRLSMPLDEVLAILAELEERGLARVSDDKGCLHARIVAITKRGRAEASRVASPEESAERFNSSNDNEAAQIA